MLHLEDKLLGPVEGTLCLRRCSKGEVVVSPRHTQTHFLHWWEVDPVSQCWSSLSKVDDANQSIRQRVQVEESLEVELFTDASHHMANESGSLGSLVLAPDNADVVARLDYELLLACTTEANSKGLKEVIHWHSSDELVSAENVEESAHH